MGLVTFCDGNFLGIAMASNLNLTNLAAGVPSTGTIKDKLRSMRLSMSTVNTKLIAVTRRPKMRANTPKFLVDRLKEIVFPTFRIRSTSSECMHGCLSPDSFPTLSYGPCPHTDRTHSAVVRVRVLHTRTPHPDSAVIL